jgi:hypothetical protein
MPASAAVSAIGLDHVRLCYDYLSSGDIDGYTSLFDTDAIIRRPDAAPIHGRDALERSHHRRGRYVVRTAFSASGWVAATGRFLAEDRPGGRDLEFADIFVVGDTGLLTAQSTYYFVPPAPGRRPAAR